MPARVRGRSPDYGFYRLLAAQKYSLFRRETSGAEFGARRDDGKLSMAS
jgi:hypothetical protein